MATADAQSQGITAEERKVIFASSLGTVFEWYDFYLYGSLAAIIAKQFFAGTDPNTAFIFALLAFAAGFLVRPFGAIVFGRLGDMVGRKYTFLVTILLMGASTFIVGLLPNYASIGIAAPIILITLRILQGLALGGEYGGAATYVAEHAPDGFVQPAFAVGRCAQLRMLAQGFVRKTGKQGHLAHLLQGDQTRTHAVVDVVGVVGDFVGQVAQLRLQRRGRARQKSVAHATGFLRADDLSITPSAVFQDAFAGFKAEV